MTGSLGHVLVVGRGRAGGSFDRALADAGWTTELVPGRSTTSVAAGTDLVIIAVPDQSVAAVAAGLQAGDAVVAHCSGSLGLGDLSPHLRVASVHPLVSLSTPETGAGRLRGAWFAVAGSGGGEEVARAVVDSLGGRAIEVPDDRRALYHATAAIASNHLVALLGQVERLADDLGIPAEAFGDLVAGTVANVERQGAAAALTGPVARGDWETVRRHVGALPVDERPTYLVLVGAAARLVDRPVPSDLRTSP